jgi:hypothetical protein
MFVAKIMGCMFLAVASCAAVQGPAIKAFTASRLPIELGTATRLSWVVVGATEVHLDNGIGNMSAFTSVYVSPPETTTYTLTATDGLVSVRKQLSVIVSTSVYRPSSVGRVYHISPAGNDANDGLSPVTPWRTVAKVNSSRFRPGDSILFQRGGEWHESLAASSSGADGSPITFADYGSGPKPKFWGSIALTNANFQSDGSGIYTYAIATSVLAVLVDHAFLYSANGHNVTSMANSWSYADGTLKINSPNSDPRVDRRFYTAVLREDVVFSNYMSNLVFRNLVVDESAAADGGYGFRIMGSRNVVVEQCEAYRAGRHHFGVINSTGFVGRNLYAAWAMPGLGHGGAIAYVSYGDASSHLLSQTSEWHNCVWDHPEDPQDHDSYYAFYCHGTKITSVLADNLTSLGGNFSVSNQESQGTAIRVRGGLVQNARVEAYGEGIQFDGMHLVGPRATLDMAGKDLLFQNMIIEGTNLGYDWYQSAIVSRGTRNTLRFSTVFLDPKAPETNTCIAIDSQSAGHPSVDAQFSYYGNIFVAPRRVLKRWNDHPIEADIGRAEYNFYGWKATFDDRDMSFADWRAHGVDRGSIQGNPNFVDAAKGDYRLRRGSRAIGAVFLSPGSLAGIASDFAGSPRPQGRAFDMGALQSTAWRPGDLLRLATPTKVAAAGLIVCGSAGMLLIVALAWRKVHRRRVSA